MTRIPSIDSATLRRLLRAPDPRGGELAIIDVREEGAFTGSGHLLYAASLPLIRLEVIADTLLPRRSARLVVVDGDGALAPRAAARLAALGYSDVSVLAGGTEAWVAAGFPVYGGAHVPSKAFAELVEHLDGTPWIDVATLHVRQRAGEDLVVLDTRSFPEFRSQTIPGAISVPGAEIVDAVRDRSGAAAASLAERHGVPAIDVRQPEEYERGHRPGFVSVPGGQLVQETDRHVATLGARIVLADDGSLVRARVTASWLARMGWDVAVLDAAPPDGVLELGPRPARVLGLDALDEPPDSLITPEALAERIGRGGVTLVDLGLSSEYRRGHLPGAWFATRGWLAASLDRLPKADALVLTSPDGAIARFAAAELRALGVNALALDGGTRAWTAAGLPLDGEARHADDTDDVWLPPRLHPDPEAAMRAYLEWEIDLVRHVGLDPDFRFRDREAALRPAAHHAA